MEESENSTDFPTRRALDCLPHAVLVTDADGCVRYANPAAERLLGGAAEDLVGRPMPELLSLVDERSGRALPDPVAEALAGPPQVVHSGPETDPVLTVTRTDESLAVRLSVGVMMEPGGEPAGAVVMIHDDADDRMRRQASVDSATQDSLTRLVNRAEFVQRLQRLLTGGEGPHALLYLEVDRFEEINARLGHAAGEFALREITRTFSELIRARDTFGRLGGDEFGLLLEHCGPAVAEQIARNLHATLVQRPLIWRDETVSLSVSVGGAVVRPGEARDSERLVNVAQSACAQAKADTTRAVIIEG